MPGPGEQHRAAATSVNPFEEVKPHINEYTAKEIATLSSRLEKQLGPEYISSRPGAGGGKVHYLSADKCINLANEVFGFNGWSSGIMNIQVDFVDENQSSGKINLGLSVVVRVTLRDGTYHEDVGYGHIENCKGKAAAFEKAKKEGTTDALKRALRNFGNLLGNCVYDKDYVARVTKLKVAPCRWDPDNLHRHPDFAPVKKNPLDCSPSRQPDRPSIKKESFAESGSHKTGEPDDEFGSDEFDEVDLSVSHGEHPDEIVLGPSLNSTHLDRPSLPKNARSPAAQLTPRKDLQLPRPPLAQISSLVIVPGPGPQAPFIAGMTNRAQGHPPPQKPLQQQQGQSTPKQPLSPAQPPPPNLPQHVGTITRSEPHPLVQPRDRQPRNSLSDGASSSDSSNTAEYEAPVRFFTARAAESVQNVSGIPVKAPAFDPHLESPSIRKTAGVDHTKTKPVGRDSIGAPPMPGPPFRTNFVNPQADKTRRVGMPVGAASPLQNRGSYKPPQMKRTVEGNLAQPQPLRDMTAASVNVPAGVGGDAKRQKTGPDLPDVRANQGFVNG